MAKSKKKSDQPPSATTKAILEENKKSKTTPKGPLNEDRKHSKVENGTQSKKQAFSYSELEKMIEQDFTKAWETGKIVQKSLLKGEYISKFPTCKETIQQLVNKYSRRAATQCPNKPGPTASHLHPVPIPVSTGSTKTTFNDKSSRAKREGMSTSTSQSDSTERTAVSPVSASPTNPRILEFREHIGTNNDVAGVQLPVDTQTSDRLPSLNTQMQFLNLNGASRRREADPSAGAMEEAVLFSAAICDKGIAKAPPQYSLLGHFLSGDRDDPRIMLNTNIPSSTFVCGLQGSGKSHTTSCIIENCMLQHPGLGILKKPLSALVLNFNEYSSNTNHQPCEAAFLACPDKSHVSQARAIPVTVLVSPSNYYNLKALYSQIQNVEVQPFLLRPDCLTVTTMLSLMSVDTGKSMPLYMGQVTKILRDMASKSASFDYLKFRACLREAHLDRSQTVFLDQRLDLLESFLDIKGKQSFNYFEPGRVTILDLSCPFVDSGTACVMFKIGIDLFLQSNPSTGKMIVADEAHKYMTDSPAAKELTASFLSIIRQQRHIGVRVVIATQEPTISAYLLGLCSVIVIHRFFSPQWLEILRKHVLAGFDKDKDDDEGGDLLQRISSLETGEALVFAPSTLFRNGEDKVVKIGIEPFKMMIRKRITWDGGKSIVSVR